MSERTSQAALSSLLFSASHASREFMTNCAVVVRDALPMLEYMETLDLSPRSPEWQIRANLRASVELFRKQAGVRRERG